MADCPSSERKSFFGLDNPVTVKTKQELEADVVLLPFESAGKKAM